MVRTLEEAGVRVTSATETVDLATLLLQANGGIMTEQEEKWELLRAKEARYKKMFP